jgi:hypothetical protein
LIFNIISKYNCQSITEYDALGHCSKQSQRNLHDLLRNQEAGQNLIYTNIPDCRAGGTGPGAGCRCRGVLATCMAAAS